MLRWALTFLLVAIVAGIFGFTDIAGASANIARMLFYIFLVLLIASAVMHVLRGNAPD